jgi:hypothetical protein
MYVHMYACMYVCMYVRTYMYVLCGCVWVFVCVCETENDFFYSNVYSELNQWFSIYNGVSAIDTCFPFFIKS